MENELMFSIVIPAYNTEKELPRCVESILSQHFNQYELIIVDDGSADRTGELIDQYASANPHVIGIHQVNMGCSEARNTGVRNAKGRYLLFVDSDDKWGDENALDKLNRVIHDKAEYPDLICFGVKILDENGRLVKTRLPRLPEQPLNSKYEIFRYLVYRNEYFSTSYVKAIKRSFFEERGLYFKKGLLSEDIEWSARLMMFCSSVAVLPEAFYERIRRNEGAITSNIGRKNIDDILGQIEKGVIDADTYAENYDFRKVYLEYWAYQYAMLYGLVYRLKNENDYTTYISRLKKLKYLLKYDHVKKVRAVHAACSFLGVRNTVKLLGMYYGRVYS